MYTNIFDTHAHYDHPKFDLIRHATLSAMPELGVFRILNCGSDEETSVYSAELAAEYPFLYSSAGIHPHESQYVADGWEERIKELLLLPKVIAVGEIGLDYFYDFSERASQRHVFARSLELALSSDLPVIIHDRDAHDDILSMLREYRPKGVIHRYSGTPEAAEKLLDLGFYLGFGGAVTYSNAKNERETLAMVPMDRLLVETDCPYLSPAGLRNEICRSDMIPYTAEVIAEIRPDYSAQEIINLATENGNRLFSIG